MYWILVLYWSLRGQTEETIPTQSGSLLSTLIVFLFRVCTYVLSNIHPKQIYNMLIVLLA